MSDILNDLHIEITTSTAIPENIELAPLNISAESTAIQRTARLLSAAPLNQLLFYLATISYRKACTLKRIQKHPPEGDTFSQSDSTTYYEDMISCSDETSTDEGRCKFILYRDLSSKTQKDYISLYSPSLYLCYAFIYL